MRIPPVGPQRERYNSIIVGWVLIVVGFLIFPIGGFLLMAGGIVMLVRARKLKNALRSAASAQFLPASAQSPVLDSAAPAQPAMPSADTALDKPFGDTFPIGAWIDEDSSFVNGGRAACTSWTSTRPPSTASSARTTLSSLRGTAAAARSPHGAPSCPNPGTGTTPTPCESKSMGSPSATSPWNGSTTPTKPWRQRAGSPSWFPSLCAGGALAANPFGCTTPWRTRNPSPPGCTGKT